MVEYEVDIEVEEAVAADYLPWLAGHVRQMLSLPGFTGATAWRVEEPPAPGRVALTVRYRLESDAALRHYLEVLAPAMRSEGVARFGDQVRIRRRVLHEWPSLLAPAATENAVRP